MRKLFKRVVSFFLIPITRWYLRKERTHRYGKLTIKIPPTVFHPGLFPSTHFLLTYVQEHNIYNKTILELGCGSGLISVWAATQNAKVVSCDLNPVAVKACRENAIQNHVDIEVYQSDLFVGIPDTKFDWIIINPPYYAKKVKNPEELAWHCGEYFEYFERLFSDLRTYTHNSSHVAMVLTQGCDLDSIRKIANRHNFQLELKREKHVLFDGKDFIFEIQDLQTRQ
ncbi:MAG: methyltransferase [Bacteroidetes bacterium]|nr:methyltransferase [Bacteroidota bacterium]